MDSDTEDCISQAAGCSPAQTPLSTFRHNSNDRAQFASYWLHQTYEYCEGISVARCALYSHYLQSCNEHSVEPVNPASFGKIIRTNFPMLKTRRLGTRGNSKYHYYGIRPRESSTDTELQHFLADQITFPLRDNIRLRLAVPKSGESSVKSTKAAQPPSIPHQHQNAEPVKKVAPSSQESLQNTFNFELFLQQLYDYTQIIPGTVTQEMYLEKLKILLECYRLFCYNIVKFALNKDWLSLDEITGAFWEQMSAEFELLFALAETQRTLSIADEYTSMILIENLAGNVFSEEFRVASVTSLVKYVENVGNYRIPTALAVQKTLFAQKLASCLKRRLALNQLFHQAKSILSQKSLVSQLSKEWSSIDLSFFSSAVTNTLGISTELVSYVQVGVGCFLEKKIPIERWIEWIKTLADNCIHQSSANTTTTSKHNGSTRDSCIRHFLQRWSFFMTQLMREFTIRNSASFASFHLIRSFLDETILFYCEGMMEEGSSSQKENSVGNCTNIEHKNSTTLPVGCISVEDLNAHMVHGNSDLLQFDAEDLLGIGSLDFSALQRAANSPRKPQQHRITNFHHQPHNSPASTSFFY